MISPDALLAELARVLAATRPHEADALVARVERAFGGGTESIPLFDGLARDVREAFGSDANRLLAPLELALLEERHGDVGVLCVVGREPIGWPAWASNGAATVDGEPSADADAAFIAVRRGDEAPFLLLARDQPASFRAVAMRAPRTGHLFVGHHQRVEVFDLATRTRIADHDVGLLWHFIAHEDLVIAVAETDVFAYEPDGTLRWSEFIDPPHVVTRDRDALVIEEQLLGTVRRIRISDRSVPSDG